MSPFSHYICNILMNSSHPSQRILKAMDPFLKRKMAKHTRRNLPYIEYIAYGRNGYKTKLRELRKRRLEIPGYWYEYSVFNRYLSNIGTNKALKYFEELE